MGSVPDPKAINITPRLQYSEMLQSTTTLSAGDKDQLPIQSIQYHSTSCLELSAPAPQLQKSSATISTFKAHLKTELFAAACDTV